MQPGSTWSFRGSFFLARSHAINQSVQQPAHWQRVAQCLYRQCENDRAVQAQASRSNNNDLESWDVKADYRRLFGAEPGEITAIALMTDTDNTGLQADAWYRISGLTANELLLSFKRPALNPGRYPGPGAARNQNSQAVLKVTCPSGECPVPTSVSRLMAHCGNGCHWKVGTSPGFS